MPQIAQLADTWSSQVFWLLVFFGITFFVIGKGMVPKVMNTVAEFMGADKFQREDGLRAFGQLLREGPLERQGRGAFTIAATSRFMSA